MAKIKAFVFKSLLAFSAFLTAWQVKMVNAQIVYMGPPRPTSVIPTVDSGNTPAIIAVVMVIFLLAAIGLVVVIKYLTGLIIRLLHKKKK
jgi:hypothetical protein